MRAKRVCFKGFDPANSCNNTRNSCMVGSVQMFSWYQNNLHSYLPRHHCAHRFDTVIKIPYSLAYLYAAFDLFFCCYGLSVRIGSWRLGICKNQYYLSLPKSTIFITRKTAKIIEDVCLLSVGSYV